MFNPLQILFKQLCIALLSCLVIACSNDKPNLAKMKVYGDINTSSWLSTDELRKLSSEQLKQRFLGQEITVSPLATASKSGYYGGENSNKCTLSYQEHTYQERSTFKGASVAVGAYVNDIPDYLIENSFVESESNHISYDKIANLPKQFCDDKCDWSPDNIELCPSRSPVTVVSGKVFNINRNENHIHIDLRVSGIATSK